MTWRSEVVPEDLDFSGPHVWPRVTAHEGVDRLIFRRPELAYRVAWRRLEKSREERGREPPRAIGVRVALRWTDLTCRPRYSDSFRHFVHAQREREDEDVGAFLDTLRAFILRTVPDRPLLNASVQLRFFDSRWRSRELLSWQERWL